MDYEVIFTTPFVADLERIIRWIAADNPAAALRLGERLIQAGESLGFFPERHPRVRQRPGVRRMIVQRHFKIFYRVLPGSRAVEILRCWDGRRGHDPVL
jgi:toxin ParE1/3/4